MNADELKAWFETVHQVLETAYLAQDEPWRQSGQSGPYERWEALRKPVADCIDRSGTFLDIGCANGYLLECCLRWTSDRGVSIEPFGLDLSAALVDLAGLRLPKYSDHFFVGNSFYWNPPRRFDFVRTELVYVPGEYERAYVIRLIKHFLAPWGKLLVANYGEGNPNVEKGLLPGSFPAQDVLARLADLGLNEVGYRDGYDPIKDRKVRIAILDSTSI